MAFSAGTYSLPGPALNTGDTVSATENNTLRNDMAAAFNKTWLRDGTAAATANIPLGGFKLTGLAAGSTNGDSVRYEQLPSSTNLVPVASGGTGATTAAAALVNLGALPSTATTGFKNRIINGAMMIDQRNAGASVTLNSGTTYTLDRWFYLANGVSKFTCQQNAGSVTPPTGFTKYMGFTVAAAVTIGASDYYITAQRIEGFNVADLGWGTASAQSITISFWVRSSLTGTFGASVQNGASNRSYPFTYTISAANTWEQKTVTIAGDTSGTWATDNTGSLTLWYGLGVGSTLSGTAGSWSGSDYRSATGATSVVGTNGATFYITGVQLEKGSTATSFDYRPYGTELALCQRYLPAYNAESSSNTGYGTSNQGSTTTRFWTSFQFPVATRTAPTGATISSVSHFIGAGQNSNFTISALNFSWGSRLGTEVFFDGSGGTSQQYIRLISQNASGQILFTGCEL